MLALSGPLWVEPGAFPRVPFLAGVPGAGAVGSWALFGALLTAVALAAAWRGALVASLVLLAALAVQDQHRFQPWVYQYLMVGLLLAGLNDARALRFARWWFAALYFHSGLSKLDVSFCRELGLLFLATLVRPLGGHPGAWPEAWRVAAVLAMPAWEIVVAVLLCVPKLRLWGLVGALALHGALLAILGPWGLGHSAIVLVWNGAMMLEVVLLFGPALAAFSGDRLTRGSTTPHPNPPPQGGREQDQSPYPNPPGAEEIGPEWLPPPLWGRVGVGWVGSTGNEPERSVPPADPPARGNWLAPLAVGAFGVGVVLPFGERWGWVDAWPAHALYASHVERTDVLIREEDRDNLPPSVRRHAGEADALGWCRLDLTGWSRAERGVPVYPSGRACNGVAEALAARYGGPGPVRVVQWGRADRWTGRRSRRAFVGLEAIRRQGDRYRLNAHPAARR